MNLGVLVMAYSLLFTTLTSQVINSWPNRKLLQYGYLEQIKDIIPNILLACVMGGIVYPIKYIHFNNIVILLIQICVGVSVYLLGSYIFRLESFRFILRIILSYVKRRSN